MKTILAALASTLGLTLTGASAPPLHTYTLTRHTLEDQRQPAFQDCLHARGQVGPIHRTTYKQWSASQRRAYDAAFWACAPLVTPSDVHEETYCYFDGAFHSLSACDPAR